ncbi:hypothetical protein KC361_g163 [Hortaea werneckii]|nr:hypothetical protein KC361_g163 [Hortaea werneckii]
MLGKAYVQTKLGFASSLQKSTRRSVFQTAMVASRMAGAMAFRPLWLVDHAEGLLPCAAESLNVTRGKPDKKRETGRTDQRALISTRVCSPLGMQPRSMDSTCSRTLSRRLNVCPALPTVQTDIAILAARLPSMFTGEESWPLVARAMDFATPFSRSRESVSTSGPIEWSGWCGLKCCTAHLLLQRGKSDTAPSAALTRYDLSAPKGHGIARKQAVCERREVFSWTNVVSRRCYKSSR